jgi:membrane protease YdiL (CAAX protease family)
MNKRLSYGRVAVFFVGFLLLWAAAWLVALSLGWQDTTPYWAGAKTVVWVVYPLLFWRAPLREQLEFIGLKRTTLRRGLVWGVAASAIWVALSLAVAPLRGQHFVPSPVTFTALYTFIITPICEEWLFRGYLQSSLVQLGRRFWVANVVTSLLFLVPHLLGWGFQGVLAANALSVYPLTIFVLSLVLGYVRQRSGSLVASVLVHASNNAFSIWWRS